LSLLLLVAEHAHHPYGGAKELTPYSSSTKHLSWPFPTFADLLHAKLHDTARQAAVEHPN
jgi:hypothetical protein